MKRLLILLLLLLPVQSQAVNLMLIAGKPPSGGITYFLQDDFEDTDGVNLTAHTADTPASSWTGDSQDTLEIDTATSQAGSSSALLGGSASYLVSLTASSGYSTGAVTCDFQWWMVDDFSTHAEISMSKGAYSFASSNFTNILRQNSAVIDAYRSGSWSSVGSITKGAWNHIEWELDLDNNTFNLWVDDTQIGTNVAFQNSGTNVEPLDTFNLIDAGTTWIDELNCYEGTRQ